MKSLTAEAIVVGMMDYRETDRIVHLYTREHGRISGLARGARKSVKRFGGVFELFARISVNFLPADSLVVIRSAEAVTIYPGIRTSLDRIASAGYAAELVSALTAEKQPNKRLFRLLCAYLEQLDNSPAVPSDRHFFEINLLNILGYRPPLDSCTRCGGAFSAEGGCWTPGGNHGLYCRQCSASGRRLSGASICLLREAMKTGSFGRICFNPEEIAEVDNFLDAFIAANISRPLKSLAFLRLSP